MTKHARLLRILALSFFFAAVMGGPAIAGRGSSPMNFGDKRSAKQWIDQRLLDKTSLQVPFSFTYDGKASGVLLKAWERQVTTKKLDNSRTLHSVSWIDSRTGLKLTCQVIEYQDFPALDWVLYVKNTGDKNTPILEELFALDARFERARPGEFTVNHLRGSDAAANDFEPLSDVIPATGALTIYSRSNPTSMAGPSGSPSVEAMPMFDVQYGNEGIVAALGWDGPWTATFEREGEQAARVRAKMNETHLYLEPGEVIRSPRVLLMFWKGGDLIDAHNIWRRLILAHYSPTPGGKPFTGLTAESVWGNVMDAEHHIQAINWWGDHDIPMECYWMDAAWTDMSRGWFAHQSDQTPNPKLYPNGMKPVSDAAHKRGMKFLLWFVPHSLNPEVGFGKKYPQFLGPIWTYPQYPGQKFYALDHGNPEINKTAIDYFSKVIKDFGVDIFRQDGTAGWPGDTDPDRSGISQIKYTMGFYEFWDGLLKNNPGLMIDNCATGARRLELETMKRSIQLHRSDVPLQPTFPMIMQAFDQGLFPWVPLHGAVCVLPGLTPYSFRSCYTVALLTGMPDTGLPPAVFYDDVAKRWEKVDMDLLRRLMKEYLAVRPYVFGDYYPLTPYSREPNVWVGWQWYRPDMGEGMVQMFRRPESDQDSIHVKLRGLDPTADYTLTNTDLPGKATMTGRQLMQDGLTVPIADKPGAAVVVYKRKS